MEKKIIGNFDDGLIGLPYELVVFNARELSQYLKKNLKKQGIDYNQFNIEYTTEERYGKGELAEEAMEKNPPREIYEYQNFFLLEKETGEYILLDGFRRLLWYNAPDINILVRIYKQTILNSSQILSLLVSLNHFKFFGGGSYYERGFALLLHTVFGLSINKYRDAFNAYLSKDRVRKDYGSDYDGGVLQNISVKERILNPFFVSDVKFLEQLNEAGFMVNRYMGALTFVERQKFDKEFLSADFIALAKANPVLKDLMPKYEKDDNERRVINQIMEIYENIFAFMRGDKVEKSYAEKVQDCKNISESIKKDKNWTKLTGVRDSFAEDIMEEMIKTGKADQLKFKCVIFPINNTDGSSFSNGENYFECGLNEEVKFLGRTKPNIYKNQDMVFGIVRGTDKFRVMKKFIGETKYRSLDTPSGYINHQVDLFVNIAKAEVEKAKKEWENECKRNREAYEKSKEKS